MKSFLLPILLLLSAFTVASADEKIRGLLEKTVKAGACAQITDALNEIYYVSRTEESEKLVANFVGANVKVLVVGTVENKEREYFLNLKSVEPYVPKAAKEPPPAAIILPPNDAPEKK